MNHRRQIANQESGYILLAVLFMMALILVALAVAVPRIAADIQRDKESELVHRGEQYKRAIKLYYKKFGRYPNSIDQLENTNNMRFLRKRYVDPMTGKDDWKIVHFGEAHVKAMGLFGQPISAGGASAIPGSTPIGGPGMPGQPFGAGGALPTSSIGSSTDSGSSSSTTSGTGTDSSTSSSTSTTPGSSPGGTGSTSAFGNGPTLGGAPMVGVVSKNTKASIKEYKQQKHYNEWEFVYDPVEDLMSSVSLLGGGGSTNLNGPGDTTPGTPGTPGSSNNPTSGPVIPGGGTSGGFGSSNPPTSPQQ